MNHDDYLEHLGIYYSQKMKVLAKNPQFISCKGDSLTSKKVFTETDKDITISCSEKKQDILFIVTLSKYIHKENEIQKLLDNLNKSFDSKGYNFEVLNNHNLIKDYGKYSSFKTENQQKIEEIKNKYKELYYNHITEKIEGFYKNRITLLKELNLITFQLKNKAENYNDLRKKYVGLVTQLQNEYLEFQELIGKITRNEDSIIITNNQKNPFIKVSDGSVKIVNENYEELLKSNKPKRESKKNNFTKGDKNLTPEEKSCQVVMCKNEVYETTHKKDFRKWALKNHPDKKKGENTEENEQITDAFRIMSNCNDKEIWCPDSNKKPEKKNPEKKQEKKPEKEKSPQKDKSKDPILQLKGDETDPDEPSPETPVSKKKTLTIDDFKEDMRVEWQHRGKIVQGTVDKINKRKKNKIMIIWDNGNNKEVEINKLKIIED